MIYIVAIVVVFLVFRKITEPKVEHIDGQRLKELLKEKKSYVFIDVRTSGEFNSNKVKGFKNIPLQSLRNKLDTLNTDDQIVLLCASGSRSMQAARVLSKAGYKNLINVKGGLGRMA